MSGGAVLLAAGFGRRFGSDKRHHPLDDGASLISHSVRLYAAAFPATLVILRPEDDTLAEEVMSLPGLEGVQVVRCADAHLGMGHSLACGAQAASAAGWSYLFVALADMPWVQPHTLAELRGVMEQAPASAVVQPRYRGTPGHPVGFGAGMFECLKALRGDAGARAVLKDAGTVLTVHLADAGILRDLDTPPGG